MLLGIARSSFYYQPRPVSAEELDLLNRLDRIFTEHPVYGSRRLQVALLREGISVGRRRIRRLMGKLGLSAIRPKRNTLAHRRRDARAPISIEIAKTGEIAKPAVAISIRLSGAILLPQQQQRDAGATQFGAQPCPVRLRPWALVHSERWAEQPSLQCNVAQPVRHRPGDADHRSEDTPPRWSG
jgi:transposase InsO family protein